MALTADSAAIRLRGKWRTKRYPVGNADILYKGALVSIEDAGFLVVAADTSADRFAGIMARQADNATGANGDINGLVLQPDGASQALLTFSDTLVAGDVGAPCYAVADDSVRRADPGNTVEVGIIAERISGTQGWVFVQPPGNIS